MDKFANRDVVALLASGSAVMLRLLIGSRRVRPVATNVSAGPLRIAISMIHSIRNVGVVAHIDAGTPADSRGAPSVSDHALY